MASHTRIVRYATLLAASLLAACTEDYDSFVVREQAAGAGGATSNGGAAGQAGANSNGGAAGQAGASSSGGAAGEGGQPGTGGASNNGGAPGQGGSSGGPQCKQVDEWCHDNNECCDQHCGRAQDDRDCYEQDRCVACNSDAQCPSGRCDNCGCVDKGTKGDSCNEDSDCQSNQCAGGKCG